MSCKIGKSYIVRSGDILFNIAQQQLGDGNRWKEIMTTEGTLFTAEQARQLQANQEVCIPGSAPQPVDNSFIQQVLQLTNAERARAGLQPLRLNTLLSQAAQRHSDSMAYQDFFGHTGPDGDPFSRMREAGYQYSAAAENIAVGQGKPEHVVRDWMNSAGHRANILNPGYVDLGVGYAYLANDTGRVNYHHYWTQTFGSPR